MANHVFRAPFHARKHLVSESIEEYCLSGKIGDDRAGPLNQEGVMVQRADLSEAFDVTHNLKIL